MQVAMYKTLNKWFGTLFNIIQNLAFKLYHLEAYMALKHIAKLQDENVKLKHQINHNELEMYAVQKKYKNRTSEVTGCVSK